MSCFRLWIATSVWAIILGLLLVSHPACALVAPMALRLWKRSSSSPKRKEAKAKDHINRNSATVPPDVAIQSLDDLPSFPPSCTLQIFYAEQIIQELGSVGELVESYHSGLLFRVNDANEKTTVLPDVVPLEFTIQWYALDFPFGAFLPKIVPHQKKIRGEERHHLEWNNTALAHYTPAIDSDRWTKGEQLVGSISGGEAFQEFCQWTLEYCQARPGYQAFEVWNRPVLSQSQTKRWAESNTCSTFTEAALIKLYELGANFGEGNGSKQLLRRSYVPLISKTKPTKVNMHDPEEAELVSEFYTKIQTAVMGENMTTSEFIRFLADKLDFFYVYDAASDEYLRVTLTRPYLALANLYQPMILPWQDRTEWEKAVVTGDSERDSDEVVGRFSSELTAAFGGVRDLVKRRLPDIVSRRLSSSVSPLLLGALVLVPLGIFATAKNDHASGLFSIDGDLTGIWNESFVSGLLVGLVTGLMASQLLPLARKESS